ncbi:MAG: hypothetical protein AVDCRST_MAG59-778 [uncultured Thermomicrobiales bacterium]|uniref:Uncharacterized protein n=1 Tax=uncultured Thermomicrobiales bacterium TaxID=1645740 RepID=A0A6J4U4P1_9BACT|nr:MAG: hypothetical protein AVDCRST_MAG59-778 [uncultured Thermomicrobiales bacterium]
MRDRRPQSAAAHPVILSPQAKDLAPTRPVTDYGMPLRREIPRFARDDGVGAEPRLER